MRTMMSSTDFTDGVSSLPMGKIVVNLEIAESVTNLDLGDSDIVNQMIIPLVLIDLEK
jgi:hypothetical protein